MIDRSHHHTLHVHIGLAGGRDLEKMATSHVNSLLNHRTLILSSDIVKNNILPSAKELRISEASNHTVHAQCILLGILEQNNIFFSRPKLFSPLKRIFTSIERPYPVDYEAIQKLFPLEIFPNVVIHFTIFPTVEYVLQLSKSRGKNYSQMVQSASQLSWAKVVDDICRNLHPRPIVIWDMEDETIGTLNMIDTIFGCLNYDGVYELCEPVLSEDATKIFSSGEVNQHDDQYAKDLNEIEEMASRYPIFLHRSTI